MPPTREYQYGFAEAHPSVVFDEEGRAQKARKILAVIRDHARSSGGDLGELSLVEIGSSTGFLCSVFAKHLRKVTGIDIDSTAVDYASEHVKAPNVEFKVGDGLKTGLDAASVDVIVCNHVYEHVPSAEHLMAEIHRVLKPGGFCYFGAVNRLVWMEQDHFLPLLSVMPRWMAHRYLRALGRGNHYYETTYTCWGLRKLVSRFEVVDYTTEILRRPQDFEASDVLVPGSLKQKAVLVALRPLYFLNPDVHLDPEKDWLSTGARKQQEPGFRSLWRESDAGARAGW